ncbi:DUF4352 domain-containing protein [Streptomyces tendae]|uniref:DUF4352 domain-containing protein n=1 Tax=Streptomyces tendae TaxID=1932 RepID=UPI003829211B
MTQPPPPVHPPQPPARPGLNPKKAIALVVGAAVVAFAIGGGTALLLQDDGDSGDDKPTVAKAPDTSPPASPSSTPESTPQQPDLKVGDTADISGEADVTAAALTYTDTGVKGIPEMLSSGQKWAVLDVKVCNTGKSSIVATPMPWSLAFAGGVRVESAGTNAGDLPQPLYPMDAMVAAGDCVRGNIAFQVPKEGRPERVLYSPEVVDEPVEWQVPKG